MHEHEKVRLDNVEVALLDAQCNLQDAMHQALRQRLGSNVGQWSVVRRALDARRQRPRYRFIVDVVVPQGQARKLVRCGRAQAIPRQVAHNWTLRRAPGGPQPVVVGAGPAGICAAYTLAKAGWAPILIERGKNVTERARDVSRLYGRGVLNEESNVCFGEGGAGTFSDGKLYTRVGDARVDHVMRLLVAHGADAEILTDNRPHLGTDRLIGLLARMRASLLEMGCIIRFNTCVQDFEVQGGSLTHLKLAPSERLEAPHTVLATGHSARSVWSRLVACGLPLESRPFAVGFRVEHPQPLLNAMRYGPSAPPELPAADYRVVHNEGTGSQRRGVYSFCMCPGGVVVTTPTSPEELCINGMSHSARRGRFGNSALVVSVTPTDFAQAGYEGVFAGVDFQHDVERRAYRAGGGDFTAPACRVSDFVGGRVSTALAASSYRRGLCPADLATLYPSEVTQALRRALQRFDHQLKGFVTSEAALIGVETRTASPVRVPRDTSLQALGAKGLYPAGEGMGYGGGIVSAAVDGVRAAEAMLQAAGATMHTTTL